MSKLYYLLPPNLGWISSVSFLFVEESFSWVSLAIDKVFWDEYEKIDLKVKARVRWLQMFCERLFGAVCDTSPDEGISNGQTHGQQLWMNVVCLTVDPCTHKCKVEGVFVFPSADHFPPARDFV